MRYADVESRLWWHTVLQVVAATALFIPILLGVGLAAIVLAFLQGHGVDIFFRAAQYGVAAYLSLLLPALVLKRSHAMIAAAIWCTAVTSVYLFMLALGISVGVTRDTGFWEWLEIGAGIVGFVVGSIAYAKTDNS